MATKPSPISPIYRTHLIKRGKHTALSYFIAFISSIYSCCKFSVKYDHIVFRCRCYNNISIMKRHQRCTRLVCHKHGICMPASSSCSVTVYSMLLIRNYYGVVQTREKIGMRNHVKSHTQNHIFLFFFLIAIFDEIQHVRTANAMLASTQIG